MIFAGAIFILAIIFAPGIFAKTEKSGAAESKNYSYQKLDFIKFDGESFVNTKVKPDEKTSLETQFSFDKNDEGEYATIFGAQDVDNNQLQLAKNSNNEWIDVSRFFGPGGGQHFNETVSAEKIYNASYADGTYVFNENSIAEDSSGFAVDAPIFLGTKSQNADGSVYENNAAVLDGKIYSFLLRDDGNLVLNLIPAARISGCGENFAIEYGFVNDLNQDGILANDEEFFANSGSGNLSGSEQISTSECPEIPEEKPSENPEIPTENPNKNDENPTQISRILPPNTGVK